MTLVFTLVGLSAAAFATFWGLSLFLQRYLYSEPADKLPLRAAVAGLLLGCFVTGWVYVNTRAPGENQYGVIHEFKPNDVSGPVARFRAVRTYPNSKTEETVAFERGASGGGQKYLSKDDQRPFALNSADYLTTALILDDDGKEVRYAAVLDDRQRYVGEKVTFREADGGRRIELSRPFDPAEPVAVISPSGGAVFLAILLNVLHLVVWVACFWPVLRFGLGHALGLAVVFFAGATILLMPLLFQQNAVPKLPPVTQATGKA